MDDETNDHAAVVDHEARQTQLLEQIARDVSLMRMALIAVVFLAVVAVAAVASSGALSGS